jgi:hypothetical protein
VQDARDRKRPVPVGHGSIEHLFRYAGRPPLATERLTALPDGRLLYRLKRRWRDGTSHVIFEPLDLVARLAALVPPPRFNLVISRHPGVPRPPLQATADCPGDVDHRGLRDGFG